MMREILEKQFWVFDLDGTLTVVVHDFAMIRAALGIPEGVDILRHLASLSDEQAHPLHQQLHQIEQQLVMKTGPARGARELVQFLSDRGCRLGILTRNSREIASLTLDHIGLSSFFHDDFILGRNESLPKPDPDGILKLAALWKTGPSTMVMVGDYLYDLKAGQAAGAATVHVHGSLERRWPEWTDLCVESLADLVAMAGQE